MQFRVGMMVKCIKGYQNNYDIVDKVGKIIEIHDNTGINEIMCIIQFNKRIERGHDGWGYGKRGYCWNVPRHYIVPIKPKQRIK